MFDVGALRMRVAINGIGIAGPTLAYWLRAFGHDPVLFEKAPTLRRGGYIIDFWGLGYEIAERMGILDSLRQAGYAMRRLQLLDARGREVAALDLEPLRDALHGRFISLARADLAATIFGACAGVRSHFGLSIDGIDQREDEVIATLSDGTRESFDLVIGADGLHSRVRELEFGPRASFESELGAYVAAFHTRGYPQREELTYVSHTAKKRHIARVSLRDDDTLVMLVCTADVLGGEPPRAEERAALRRTFAGLGWEAPQILGRMQRTDDLYFDRVSQIHMPKWWSRRVALIGDAAACPSLLAGEGTGLAMIEAYVLAGELSRAGGDFTRAFETYDARLRDFVTAKQKGARGFLGFFAPKTRLGLAFRTLAVKALSIPFIARRFLARSVQDRLDLPDYGHRADGPAAAAQ